MADKGRTGSKQIAGLSTHGRRAAHTARERRAPAWSGPPRPGSGQIERFIQNYSGEQFDLAIIGGGITGAALAYDAASRGLAVALVEKQDFGCGTSSVTSKLIHGGFRYLANFELGLVRGLLRERRILENIAPNLVYPLPGLITAYNNRLLNHPGAIRLAMIIYDLLSFNGGRAWDRSRRTPRHRMIGAAEALRLEPNIKPAGLRGAGLQYDRLCLCPERLTLAFVKSATRSGARVANYAQVEKFLTCGNGRVVGVRARDLTDDRTVELRAKLTVNCCGPWADTVLGLLGHANSNGKLRRSEGIHIITGKLVDRHMVACMVKSGSHIFLLPWRGHTLIGTTDREYIGDPDGYRVTRSAIMELLEQVNGGFGLGPLEYDDVLYAYGGLRPLVENGKGGVYGSSRRYELQDNGLDGHAGLLTVRGGKYTACRNIAEKAMRVVAAKLGANTGKCITHKRRLAGCEIDDIERFIAEIKAAAGDFDEKTVDWLARHYGTEAGAVLELARQDAALGEPLDADGEIAAQVAYAVREEMALTLNDILLRRTGIGTLGYPGAAVIDKVATIAARELGWDDGRKKDEIGIARRSLALPQ